MAQEPEIQIEPEAEAAEDEKERKRRRLLLIILLVMLLLLCCVCGLFFRYIQKPRPLPELLPAPVNVNYPPHYLFSIYGVDQPVGVAIAPDSGRIYVSETGGERLVKIFDRQGNLLGSFSPPRTTAAERSPVYLDVDGGGRVFVSDRLQNAVFVYDRDGKYIDSLLGPDLTLSEYVAKHTGGLPAGAVFGYDVFEPEVYYQKPGGAEQTLPAPDPPDWDPLGVYIDGAGRLLVTDVGPNAVREFPPDLVLAASWQAFDPAPLGFGATGQGDGQFLFPNDALTDSQGRYYVVDGNNGRVSMWNAERQFLINFGAGTGESAFNLPRGADVDERDRLYVADAVGQNVKVYDVSGVQPVFLFVFGDWGAGDGQFNYPNDIALDDTGRLYIVDRENNRVQVWSY